MEGREKLPLSPCKFMRWIDRTVIGKSKPSANGSFSPGEKVRMRADVKTIIEIGSTTGLSPDLGTGDGPLTRALSPLGREEGVKNNAWVRPAP